MKTLYIFFLCFLYLKIPTRAQIFNHVSLENDSIKFLISNLGSNFWDYTYNTADFEYPKGSGIQIGSLNGLWFSGINSTQDSLACIQLFGRGNKFDYFPGPLDQNGQISSTRMINWNRHWKITSNEIEKFKEAYAEAGFDINDPQWISIREWPAKNNTYTRGRYGSNISADVAVLNKDELAPFEDLNNNNSYEPDQGEYPLIKGDIMVWWTYNDAAGIKTNTFSPSMKLQIVSICYIFKQNTLLDNQIFFESTVYNKSGQDYSQFCASIILDADIGYYAQEQIGIDLTNRVSFNYVDKLTNPFYLGNPHKLKGYNIPIVGTYYHSVNNNATGNSPLYSAIYYHHSGGTSRGEISGISDLFKYREAMDKLSIPYKSNCETNIGNPTKFPFSDQNAKMCDCNTLLDDYSVLQSSTPQDFKAGESMKIDYAVVLRNYEYECTEVDPWTDVVSLVSSKLEETLSSNNISSYFADIHIYPNPAKDYLNINSKNVILDKLEVQVFNSFGQKVPFDIIDRSSYNLKIDIQDFAQGNYVFKFDHENACFATYKIEILQ